MLQQVQVIAIGSGKFPLDMLRYDHCYPASESDAYLIERTFKEYGYWRICLSKTVGKAKKQWRDYWVIPRWVSFNVILEDARFHGAKVAFETFEDVRAKAKQDAFTAATADSWVQIGPVRKSPSDPTLG